MSVNPKTEKMQKNPQPCARASPPILRTPQSESA